MIDLVVILHCLGVGDIVNVRYTFLIFLKHLKFFLHFASDRNTVKIIKRCTLYRLNRVNFVFGRILFDGILKFEFFFVNCGETSHDVEAITKEECCNKL